MKTMRILPLGLATLFVAFCAQITASGDPTPDIASLSKPAAGYMQMLFHGGTGPFQVQKRMSLDPTAPWSDIVGAKVTQVNPGVFMAVLPVVDTEDIAFYRVLSVGETIVELQGWSIAMKVSAPTNGLYFVQGESPLVTVTLLDTFAQGLSRADFSSLNLYMYGPQDPQKTVTAVKLLNANTNRAVRPHHYIDLKTNTDVQDNSNIFTYRLQPVTDEAPGTYRLSLWAVRGTDAIQQVMRFADLQIGTATVESPVVDNHALDGTAKCASCHQGPISGKTYMHHVDPVPNFFPAGNWSLDYEPVKSCKSCHNNDGYAAYSDTNAPGGKVSDTIARRAHGVHMGADLKLPFNINSVNGDFKDYTHVEFPADVRDCSKCHLDDRWKTKPSRAACTGCHDNVWFGDQSQTPAGMTNHPVALSDDLGCSLCHPPDGTITSLGFPISAVHELPVPPIDVVNISMTPPANGTYYVAGEKPMVTVVFMDDTGTNAIDHTKVTDANFSTANLFVYGPRSRAVPVLTSAARNVNSKLRASVSSSIPGPWAISNAIFKIAINGSAPQEITMVGASNLVTAAEVVASLNPVITNLNAKASVAGANVNIKTLIQGANARIEIYNGDVTTAMGWKRAPNTVMEPDVTIAAAFLANNDLRALSDPLDYSDPMVTRNTTNITYQLDDVAGLDPGTYSIYVYHLPKPGKITGIATPGAPFQAQPVGMAHILFQVGTATAEKKIATNCQDCHGNTIFHLASGPIHPEPFDTDYCDACHDYGHTAIGDMFKNQGGTSLNGWSGFGAMPIVRRVHGVHQGNYLQHPEEIYANATVDTFGHIIFPQDIRNCTKCHAETDTWKQKPARIACLACHDSDAAKAHGSLNTYMPDPADPYGPAAQESCDICHGAGADFSPDKVHSISSPYVPPYPRAPRP